MSKSLNKIFLMGHVGNDPDVKRTTTGKSVVNFSLATNKKNKDGEKAVWHKVVAWEKLADICAQYVHKGDKVFVEGELDMREWEDRDGKKRTTPEIIANNVILLGSKSGSRMAEQGPDVTPHLGQPDDDIPF